MPLKKRKAGRQGRDPHWTVLRYAGVCSACRTPLAKGAAAFYYPNDRTLLGKTCCAAAGDAARDFAARAFDDQVLAYQFGPAGPPR